MALLRLPLTLALGLLLGAAPAAGPRPSEIELVR
jgi:hypothetical protein